MQAGAKAYGAVAKQTANPRELEADLLLTAAARLQNVRDGWSNRQTSDLESALLYNRRLWSIFVSSCTSPENPLPSNVRQNVANIGLFVLKHTLTVLANPKPENLHSLININREIAAGLLGRA